MIPAAVFFDFDGVILDSANIKTRAMRELFKAEQPAHVEAIIALHLRHSGVSRYRKFEMIHRDILGRPLSNAQSATLGSEFEKLAFDAVMLSPEITGARAVLEAYFAESPLFVISGTPETELRRIVQARDLVRYFAEIHGSPRTKPDILYDLLRRRGLTGSDCVFVGDGLTDFEAARDCAVPFIGIVPRDIDNPFEPHVPVVADLTEFNRALRAISRTGATVKGDA